MQSRSLLAALAVGLLASHGARAAPLRVCADPDYLPYSNKAGQGFENKVAELVGRLLGQKVEYTWASYRGHGGFEEFLARTLDAGKCDLVMNLPYGSSQAYTTRPYYVSSYVFLFKKAKNYDITSMDSPVLRTLKVGFEEDTPPEDGLKLRGMVQRAMAFDVGSRADLSPSTMLDAVRSGQVDVMITWEPAVGQFLSRYPDLEVVPVPNERATGSPERYSFPMSMAVRTDDKALADRINAVIAAHDVEIRAILQQYGVRLYTPPALPGGA